ncbi:MAG TPA: peptidylprolyl isomerase [Bryobacteraceae bacterium]|nr:peptidylprolyl isomerase [Bryobacteraceae bacterium]
MAKRRERAGITLGLAIIALGAVSCQRGPEKIVVPEVFRVRFDTSQGSVVVEAKRAWAPRGVDRFHELIRIRYFDEGRFYRVVPGFVAQFGVHRDYDVHDKWRKYFILDDPPKEKNTRGTLTFAQAGPNTRATEIFINLGDNTKLDAEGFVPFAKVVEGMDAVDKFYAGYGELRPEGKEIDPGHVEEGTNAYLIPHFPKMDYIKHGVFLK